MLLRRLALASLVANVGIVLTGGAVRLTGSGLGCPTWPKCTDESYAATAAMGINGAIEFSNRVLGAVVGLIAVALMVAALRARPRDRVTVRLALVTLTGVLAQGLLGGVTVRTGLNPWTVAAHFLVSMILIAAGYALWRRVTGPPSGTAVPRQITTLTGVLTVVTAVVLVLGTLVTGSGPHAGDPDTERMGFDLTTVAQLHADAVFLLVGLSVALWFALRAVNAPQAARAAGVLVLVELSQGAVGMVQYFTHLPVLAVGLHMAGACAVWLATLALWPRLRPWTATATGTAQRDAAEPESAHGITTPGGVAAAATASVR